MEPSTAAFVGGAVGLLIGAVTVLAFRLSEREQGRGAPTAPEPLVPPGVATVLSVLRSSALVVGPDDTVLKASAPAHALGIVRGSSVAMDELLELVRQVRRDGQIRESEFVLPQRRGRALHVAARVAPLGSRLILVLVEDRTRERRVEAIRRDFVANVSHELKTPVGALTLLAEAVAEAADDPEAVQRFSARMRTESERLTRLVQQIIELSRLQGDDPLDESAPIAVDAVVERALDRIRVDASTKGVELTFGGVHGLQVAGDAEQLIVALGNLVENAVVYSPEGTSVGVAAAERDGLVEIAVTDHGVGIPADELERIFERFYRVDPARARTTGGTGLGLSIVKHVAATHGGEVRVWSVEGEGSTFTLALPAFDRHVTEPTAPEPSSAEQSTNTPDPTPSAPGSEAPATTRAAAPAQHQEAS
jgi:two-component system sensor histidine kinase SenX3